MTLKDLAEKAGLQLLTPELGDGEAVSVRGAYASDLLSDVLANAPHDGVLITIQVHLNVVAVAVHADLAGIIFAAGREPDEAVREKAVEEGIRLYMTDDCSFDVSGRLYAMGLRGRAE
jgi:hypothetical protein